MPKYLSKKLLFALLSSLFVLILVKEINPFDFGQQNIYTFCCGFGFVLEKLL